MEAKMTLSEMKQRLSQTAEQKNDDIRNIGEYALRIPELGYKENKTSAFIREQFDRLGIKYEYPLALTGVYLRLLAKSVRNTKRRCNKMRVF
jgi:metal-dependent amidase/aminoacylase/carboxypeptidase family protein